MDTAYTIADLRKRLAGEKSIALVPTMGNLHAGHISLVEMARRRAGCVVATVFVNRLQFAPGGDFDRYPRTLAQDRWMLEKAQCDVVFAPDEDEMYPQPQQIHVTPPEIAKPLEGDFRPGHFQGVCTVVAKLFNIVKPTVAVFGKKDYQQLAVIRAMERQLDFGIEIVGGETIREPDGLAMSSRNAYLSPDERQQGLTLSRALAAAQASVAAGERNAAKLLDAARATIATARDAKIDYLELRDPDSLHLVETLTGPTLFAMAVFVGKTRLIDNRVLRF